MAYIRKHRYAASTINLYLFSLSALFNVMEKDWQWIEQNPLKYVQRVKPGVQRRDKLRINRRIVLRSSGFQLR